MLKFLLYIYHGQLALMGIYARHLTYAEDDSLTSRLAGETENAREENVIRAKLHGRNSNQKRNSTRDYLARSAYLSKGLYIVRRVWDVSEYISVAVSQIITKFGECAG